MGCRGSSGAGPALQGRGVALGWASCVGLRGQAVARGLGSGASFHRMVSVGEDKGC